MVILFLLFDVYSNIESESRRLLEAYFMFELNFDFIPSFF